MREVSSRTGLAPVTLARIADPALLRQAWRRVRANQGGPGGDGVRLEAFAEGLDSEIERLASSLANRSYRPGPLRRCAIPKPDGGERWLAIPCVRDRVVQSATLMVLQPFLEARQSAASFAYRPARGVSDALAAVRQAHASGLIWTLEADIVHYFDSIPHNRLLAELTIWIEAEEVLRLIALWVDGFSKERRGVAQGAPISPLLANLFLHPLDRLLVASGHVPVRYADDFVVLAESAAAVERARHIAAGILRDRGLALKPAKTLMVAPGTPFRFLGETLCAPTHLRLQ